MEKASGALPTLFEYKKKFDQSYLEVGFKRPEMGGARWKNSVSTNLLSLIFKFLR